MRFAFASAALLAVAGLATADEIKLDKFKITPKFKDSSADAVGHNEGEGKLFMYIHGTAAVEVEVKEDGHFALVIEMSGDKGKTDNPKVRIAVDGKDVEKEFMLTALEAKAYTFKTDLKKGKVKVEIEFLNDEYKENEYDSNLYIHSLKVEAAKKDEKKDEKKEEKK
jgi:hypothetical protein